MNRNYNSQSGNGPQKIVKLRCSGCGKKKDPELFSKVRSKLCSFFHFITENFLFPVLQRQRKENENARCMACVKKDEDDDSD